LSPTGTQAPPPRIGLLRRLLYGLLTLALFAGGLELALAGLDLGGGNRLSVLRGFALDVDYVVPDAARPGGFQVHIADAGQPPIDVPPKGAAPRVLLLGGSNTAGWPTRRFRDMLDAGRARKDLPGFEVYNLGRAGYGSGRVRILLEQALVTRPDVVVIHSGHNEFVERGFAWELLRRWKSTAVLSVLDTAMRLRALAHTVDVLRARHADADGAALPDRSGRSGSDLFEQMTYDQTLFFYESYRENLRAMVAAARAAGSGVLLTTVLSNMFDAPMLSTPPPALSAADLERLRSLREGARELLPRRYTHGLIATGPDAPVIRLAARDWGHLLPDEEFQQRLRRQGLSPAPALRTCTGVLSGAPYWNPRELWSDNVVELMPTIAAVCERSPTNAERAALEQALVLYSEALGIAPDLPDLLHESGICHYLLGHDALAEEHLRASMRFDRAPIKGNDASNDIVRAIAAEYADDPGVRCVDVDALFRERSPQRLVGYEVMYDNCHPHLLARLIILEDLAPAVLELAARD
jgi:hypothetical protein